MPTTLRRISLVLAFLAGSAVFAQEDASPLTPDLSKPERLGAFIGFSGLWQKGPYSVDCNCNSFDGGGGSGLLLGALYESTTTTNFLWGAQLGYNHREINAKYVLNEDTTLRSIDGKSSFTNIAIPFRHTSNVSLNAIYLQPYFKWFPFGHKVFLRIGAAANIVFSANKDFHKILLTNTVILPNDDVVRLELDRAAIEASGKRMVNDNEVVVQDGPMNDINRFQIAIQPAIGVELRVGKRVLLVPVLEYSYPVSAVSSKDTDFRIQGIHGVFELHFQL